MQGAEYFQTAVQYAVPILDAAFWAYHTYRIGNAFKNDWDTKANSVKIIDELEREVQQKLCMMYYKKPVSGGIPLLDQIEELDRKMDEVSRSQKIPLVGCETIKTSTSLASGLTIGAVGTKTGAWAGGMAGAYIGSVFGPAGSAVLTPIGAIVGAFYGGLTGVVAGDLAGESLAEQGLKMFVEPTAGKV